MVFTSTYAIEPKLPRTNTTPVLNDSGRHPVPFKGLSLDLSDDSLSMLRRELEVEERIMEAARRMAELPTSNRRERQKRKQSLQQSVVHVEYCIIIGTREFLY